MTQLKRFLPYGSSAASRDSAISELKQIAFQLGYSEDEFHIRETFYVLLEGRSRREGTLVYLELDSKVFL